MKNDIASLDYLKFIMSVLIVILHTGGGYSPLLINTLCRLATPVFFIVSGYFLNDKYHNVHSFFKYIYRLLLLYLVWTLVYMPYALEMRCYVWDFNSLINALIHGTFIQLWYFPALLFAAITMFLLLRIVNIYVVGCIALIPHIWGILAFTYKVIPSLYDICPSTMKLIDNSPNNFFYFGLFYVWLGLFIRKNKWTINKWLMPLGLLVIIPFTLEAKWLIYIKGTVPTTYFTLIPAAVFLTYACLQVKIKFLSGKIFRNMSTVIYGVHYIFYFIWQWYISPNIQDEKAYSMLLFVLTCSIAVAALCVLGSKKLKILKIFY